MPSKIDEVNVWSLVLDGQKDIKEDVKTLTSDVKLLTSSVSQLTSHASAQKVHLSNLSDQMERLLNKVDNHAEILSMHSSQIIALEASQEAYMDAYRYNKKSLVPTDKDSGNLKIPPVTTKPFLSFPPQTAIDIVKFIGLGLLGLGAIVGSIISQINF